MTTKKTPAGHLQIAPQAAGSELAGLAAGSNAVTPTADWSTKGTVTVSWNGGTRVYSKEVHGADYLDYAKEFAAKFNGTLA